MSTHHLCQFHIVKNVKAKMKSLARDNSFHDEIMNTFHNMMNSPNEREYTKELRILHRICGETSDFVTYLNTTWLKYRHKFVKFHIDKAMHLGNTTTNR